MITGTSTIISAMYVMSKSRGKKEKDKKPRAFLRINTNTTMLHVYSPLLSLVLSSVVLQISPILVTLDIPNSGIFLPGVVMFLLVSGVLTGSSSSYMVRVGYLALRSGALRGYGSYCPWMGGVELLSRIGIAKQSFVLAGGRHVR